MDTTPSAAKPKGAMVVVIIVIIILILGAIYFARVNDSLPVDTDTATTTAFGPETSSTEVSDLAAEANATNYNNLDTEIDAAIN